jgi:hypothetical protein
LRVHAMGVDRQTGILARKPFPCAREAEFMPYDIHQVGCVPAVDHAEGGIEPDCGRTLAQEAVGDRVKRAGPAKTDVLLEVADDPLSTARHLDRRAPAEGQEENSIRIDACTEKVGDSVRERVRLAGAGARDDKERAGLAAIAVLGRLPLALVQFTRTCAFHGATIVLS